MSTVTAPPSTPSCVVLLASWYKVGIPEDGTTLRHSLIDALNADVIALLTYRDDDNLANPEAVVKERTAGLLAALSSRLVKLQIERQLTTRELGAILEAQPSWPTIWKMYAEVAGCRRWDTPASGGDATKRKLDVRLDAVMGKLARENYNATSPYVCPGLKENGNSFMAPLLGNAGLNVLRQLYMHHRVLALLNEHEASPARGGTPYTHVVWSRLEYMWIRPHLPLSLLNTASARSQPKCDLWVPLEEDYAGLNDRHAFMTRDAAKAYPRRTSRRATRRSRG